MKVEASPLESARFGRSIGRGELGGEVPSADVVARACAAFDIVVVRAPAGGSTLAADLARVPGRVAFTADHLAYWSWTADRFTVESMPDVSFDVEPEPSVLDGLLRRTFDGYDNHYAANPLLDPTLVVEGYADWVAHLVGSEAATAIVSKVRTSGDATGFAVIDWSVDVPDVRLAGMVPEHRGRGAYAHLLSACMAMSIERGRSGLQISTQSSNVGVMRAWARLGLLPVRVLQTIHLVRSDLL